MLLVICDHQHLRNAGPPVGDGHSSAADIKWKHLQQIMVKMMPAVTTSLTNMEELRIERTQLQQMQVRLELERGKLQRRRK